MPPTSSWSATKRATSRRSSLTNPRSISASTSCRPARAGPRPRRRSKEAQMVSKAAPDRLGLGRVTASAASARADEVDETLRKLIDLDQRAHVMGLELRDAPPPPPDQADRRVLAAH